MNVHQIIIILKLNTKYENGEYVFWLSLVSEDQDITKDTKMLKVLHIVCSPLLIRFILEWMVGI